MERLLVHKKKFFWIAISWTLFWTVLFLQPSSSLPAIKISGFDKFVHASFHCIFTTIWFLSFYTNSNQFQKSIYKAFSFSVIYGITIELVQQMFTTSRQADILDVCANVSGAFIASIVIVIVENRTQKK